MTKRPFRVSFFALGLAVILAGLISLAMAGAYTTDVPIHAVSGTTAFQPMPMVPKGRIGVRPQVSSGSSGSRSSRGSGSYRYRRSYRGGGYSSGK